MHHLYNPTNGRDAHPPCGDRCMDLCVLQERWNLAMTGFFACARKFPNTLVSDSGRKLHVNTCRLIIDPCAFCSHCSTVPSSLR